MPRRGKKELQKLLTFLALWRGCEILIPVIGDKDAVFDTVASYVEEVLQHRRVDELAMDGAVQVECLEPGTAEIAVSCVSSKP